MSKNNITQKKLKTLGDEYSKLTKSERNLMVVKKLSSIIVLASWGAGIRNTYDTQNTHPIFQFAPTAMSSLINAIEPYGNIYKNNKKNNSYYDTIYPIYKFMLSFFIPLSKNDAVDLSSLEYNINHQDWLSMLQHLFPALYKETSEKSKSIWALKNKKLNQLGAYNLIKNRLLMADKSFSTNKLITEHQLLKPLIFGNTTSLVAKTDVKWMLKSNVGYNTFFEHDGFFQKTGLAIYASIDVLYKTNLLGLEIPALLGHHQMLLLWLKKVAKNCEKDKLQEIYFDLLRFSLQHSRSNQTLICKTLYSLLSDKTIQAKNNIKKLYCSACYGGDCFVVEKIFEKLSFSERADFILNKSPSGMYHACQKGHLKLFKLLITTVLTTDTQKNYINELFKLFPRLFRQAAIYSSGNIVNFLISTASQQQNLQLIKEWFEHRTTDLDFSCRRLLQGNQLDAVKTIFATVEKYNKNFVKTFLQKYQYECIKISIMKKNISFFKYFLKKINDYNLLKDMLTKNKYQAFSAACFTRYTEAITILTRAAIKENCMTDMICSENYLYFSYLCNLYEEYGYHNIKILISALCKSEFQTLSPKIKEEIVNKLADYIKDSGYSKKSIKVLLEPLSVHTSQNIKLSIANQVSNCSIQ